MADDFRDLTASNSTEQSLAVAQRTISHLGKMVDAMRLTEDERTAIIWCVEMAALHATDCDEELATLRGLLERTK